MAKRTRKATNPEFPPLYMVIEKGRLVPAFQPDYERLSAYKDGTRIICHIEPDGTRKGIRNWYRIIGTVCKKDLLHGLTQTQADEAIRGALDMFNPVRMANGKWVEQRMSLNDMDDAELDDKIELMKGILLAWTGIDPDTFNREIGGSVGDENFASDVDREGFARHPAADNNAGQGGAESSSPETESGAATTSPDAVSQAPSGEAPAAAETSTPNAGSGGTSVETVGTSLDRAAMMIAAIPDDVKPGTAGNCTCPNCGKTLKWSRAKSNGHVAVQCMQLVDDGRGNGTWERGCFGPLRIEIDRNVVWPRPAAKQESPADVASGQHEAVSTPSGDGEASGSNGLAATAEPELPPEDRAWLVEAAKSLMRVAKEGTTRAEVIAAAKASIVSMPKDANKRATAGNMDMIMKHVFAVGRGAEQVDWEKVAGWAHATVKDIAELE
jgi:hypothetical protein